MGYFPLFFHFVIGNPVLGAVSKIRQCGIKIPSAGARNRGYGIGVIAPVEILFSSPIYRPRWPFL